MYECHSEVLTKGTDQGFKRFVMKEYVNTCVTSLPCIRGEVYFFIGSILVRAAVTVTALLREIPLAALTLVIASHSRT